MTTVTLTTRQARVLLGLRGCVITEARAVPQQIPSHKREDFAGATHFVVVG